MHFVADVHQPLHTGYADDKGGNTYQLQAFGKGAKERSPGGADLSVDTMLARHPAGFKMTWLAAYEQSAHCGSREDQNQQPKVDILNQPCLGSTAMLQR